MNQQGKFLGRLEIGKVYPANEVYDFLRRGSLAYIPTNFSNLKDLHRTNPNLDYVKVTEITNGWNRFEDGHHVIGHENSRIYHLEKQ